MSRTRLAAVALFVTAALVVAGVAVTRWSFRSWPSGAYLVVPLLVAAATGIVLLFLGRFTARRGLPLPVLAAAWYAGRIAGALASAVFPGVGIDAALIATASFGLIAPGVDGPLIGPPDPAAALLGLALLAAGHVWGGRGSDPARGKRPQG